MYFIVDGRNNLQHPTKKHDMIIRWISTGKAKFIGRDIVQVFKKFDRSKTIDCRFIIGLDPGYKNIGYSVFKIYKNQIQNILNGEVLTRTSEITKLISERRMYRRSRRSKHRENILRKFGRAKFKAPRWKNRKKKPWAPTHMHLFQSHLNLLQCIFNRIDYNQSEIVLEHFKFDSQKALDSTVSSWKYQKGPQFGFENVKAYVRARDNYKCQICGEKLLSLSVHHIQERADGGSDRPENLVTLCQSCHLLLHQTLAECPRPSKASPMRDSGVLNSCMNYLVNYISPAYTITGSDTAALRHYYNIEKSHVNDAKVIALSKLDLENFNCQDLSNTVNLKQFRRHTRNCVQRYEDRKYICDGFTVAWNRKSRSTQAESKPSLQEFKQEYPEEKVVAKPGRIIYFRTNSQAKFRPGDIFKHQNINYVLKQWASTQGTVTSETEIKFKIRNCRKIRNNSGLVTTS